MKLFITRIRRKRKCFGKSRQRHVRKARRLLPQETDSADLQKHDNFRWKLENRSQIVLSRRLELVKHGIGLHTHRSRGKARKKVENFYLCRGTRRRRECVWKRFEFSFSHFSSSFFLKLSDMCKHLSCENWDVFRWMTNLCWGICGGGSWSLRTCLIKLQWHKKASRQDPGDDGSWEGKSCHFQHLKSTEKILGNVNDAGKHEHFPHHKRYQNVKFACDKHWNGIYLKLKLSLDNEERKSLDDSIRFQSLLLLSSDAHELVPVIKGFKGDKIPFGFDGPIESNQLLDDKSFQSFYETSNVKPQKSSSFLIASRRIRVGSLHFHRWLDVLKLRCWNFVLHEMMRTERVRFVLERPKTHLGSTWNPPNRQFSVPKEVSSALEQLDNRVKNLFIETWVIEYRRLMSKIIFWLRAELLDQQRTQKTSSSLSSYME